MYFPFKDKRNASQKYNDMYFDRYEHDQRVALVRVFPTDRIIIGSDKEGNCVQANDLFVAKATMDKHLEEEKTKREQSNEVSEICIAVDSAEPIVGSVRWFKSFKTLEFKVVQHGKVVELHGDGKAICGWTMNRHGDCLDLRDGEAYILTYMSNHMQDKLLEAAWNAIDADSDGMQIVFK